MLKSLPACAILLLSVLMGAGQTRPVNTAKGLLSRIQKSKVDTGRIALLLELGNYYLDRSDEHRNALDTALVFFNQAENYG